MSKYILEDLTELREAGVISEATSEAIKAYYNRKAQAAPNRMILVFGILGAVLVGLGIILIIAHNWDNLSRGVKVFYALLPLILSQSVCAYALFRKTDSRTWREASSVFLFFSIAASISIVSQVYNIPGGLSGFIFIWMLLSIPLVYVMQSAMSSLLVICGITVYACSLSYFEYPREIAWYYWPMLASLLPFFFRLMRTRAGNFVNFHTWVIALSVIVTLNMFNQAGNYYMFIAYISLFSLFILLAESGPFASERGRNNALGITGNLGLTFILLLLTFRFVWEDIARTTRVLDEAFYVSLVVTLVAAAFLVRLIVSKGISAISPTAFSFLLFIILFELGGIQPTLVQWLVNILVLALAVFTTWRGAEGNNIFVLNYGLLILAALIICRFFDTDMSFIVRGILFLIVGISFFGANYWVLKQRKLHDL